MTWYFRVLRVISIPQWLPSGFRMVTPILEKYPLKTVVETQRKHTYDISLTLPLKWPGILGYWGWYPYPSDCHQGWERSMKPILEKYPAETIVEIQMRHTHDFSLCYWSLILLIQNDAKYLKNDWNPGTWVLICKYSVRAYLMNTNMTGFRCFSKIFASMFLGQKCRVMSLPQWLPSGLRIVKPFLTRLVKTVLSGNTWVSWYRINVGLGVKMTPWCLAG